jgi:hypothetical protein
MGRNNIEEIKNDGHGNITILHSNGAFHYKEEDVVRKEWTNDFRCLLDFNSIPKGHVVGFVGIAAFIVVTLVRMFSLVFLWLFPNPEIRSFTVIALIVVLICIILGYLLTRCYYFYMYRDLFHKTILSISLKSNIKGDFYVSRERIIELQKYGMEHPLYSGVNDKTYLELGDWRSSKYGWLFEFCLVFGLGIICFESDLPPDNFGMMPTGMMFASWILVIVRDYLNKLD